MQALKQGAKGSAVRTLQQRLCMQGFTVTQDGIFGGGTQRAVLQFQQAHNLTVDGIVGPHTWALLDSVPLHTPSEPSEAEWLIDLATLALGKESRQVERLAVLRLACRDLGKAENPSGSNEGEALAHLLRDGDGQSYWQHRGVAGVPAPPWCAIAVSSWIRLGLAKRTWAETPFQDWFGAVSQVEDWAHAHAGCYKPLARPDQHADALAPDSYRWCIAPVGAIFLMSRANSGSDDENAPRAGHCGLVVSDDGDSVYAVEANVRNSVAWQHRKKNTLTGYALWWNAMP